MARGIRPLNTACALTLLLLSAATAAQPLTIALPDKKSMHGWEERSFRGHTEYVPQEDGSLKATSRGSASGLFLERRIDVSRLPYLSWRWRVERTLAIEDERIKAGDDYAARLYVVVGGGLLFWNTRAINYVWASDMQQGSRWPNAYAGDRAMMVALQDKNSGQRQWYREQRHIVHDFAVLHKEDIRYIDGLAIMTDSDDSGGQAVAYYSEIQFHAAPLTTAPDSGLSMDSLPIAKIGLK